LGKSFDNLPYHQHTHIWIQIEGPSAVARTHKLYKTIFGAVAGTNTQTGSSPSHRSCIFITKDEELGQIYVLCLLESAVQISPARPKLLSPKKAILEHYFSIDRIFVVFSFSVLGQTGNLSASFTYANWFFTQNYRGCLL
jgi:hypothetical protein